MSLPRWVVEAYAPDGRLLYRAYARERIDVVSLIVFFLKRNYELIVVRRREVSPCGRG